MITLYGVGPGFGLPEVSPFVTKTEVQLRMAGLPYRKEPTGSSGRRRASSRTSTIPARSCPIPPSSATIWSGPTASISTRASAPASAPIAWAVERMLENHLGWASSYFRWIVPENFAAGPAHLFDHAPEALRESLRREVQARIADRLFGQGMGRHSHEEIAELGTRTLWSLAAILGDKPYLMGDRPTAVDATALGMLAGLLAPVFRSPLREMVEDTDNLALYTARMMRRFYPEFVWEPGEQVRLSRLARPRERIDVVLAPSAERRPSPRRAAYGLGQAARSVDWMRWMPAPSRSFQALAREPPASMPRQASSIT